MVLVSRPSFPFGFVAGAQVTHRVQGHTGSRCCQCPLGVKNTLRFVHHTEQQKVKAEATGNQRKGRGHKHRDISCFCFPNSNVGLTQGLLVNTGFCLPQEQ